MRREVMGRRGGGLYNFETRWEGYHNEDEGGPGVLKKRENQSLGIDLGLKQD